MFKKIFLYTLIFFIAIAFAVNYVKSEEGVSVGYQAPDFKLKYLGGKDETYLSKYRGKPVVVVFWATWCGPCRKEIPDLKELYEKYSPKGVVFLTVAVGYRQTEEVVSKFQIANNIPYPILWDKDNEVSEKYQVAGIPTNLVIDQNGIIRYRDFALTKKMVEVIDSLLAIKR